MACVCGGVRAESQKGLLGDGGSEGSRVPPHRSSCGQGREGDPGGSDNIGGDTGYLHTSNRAPWRNHGNACVHG